MNIILQFNPDTFQNIVRFDSGDDALFSLDTSASIDAPASIYVSSSLDAPASQDAPASIDAISSFDAPANLDAFSSQDAPASIDVSSNLDVASSFDVASSAQIRFDGSECFDAKMARRVEIMTANKVNFEDGINIRAYMIKQPVGLRYLGVFDQGVQYVLIFALAVGEAA